MLIRGWILTQLRADPESSPAATVDRIAREIEQPGHEVVDHLGQPVLYLGKRQRPSRTRW